MKPRSDRSRLRPTLDFVEKHILQLRCPNYGLNSEPMSTTGSTVSGPWKEKVNKLT